VLDLYGRTNAGDVVDLAKHAEDEAAGFEAFLTELVRLSRIARAKLKPLDLLFFPRVDLDLELAAFFVSTARTSSLACW
jgi:hypothetical protein